MSSSVQPARPSAYLAFSFLLDMKDNEGKKEEGQGKEEGSRDRMEIGRLYQ
jgi:hypothetical protein